MSTSSGGNGALAPPSPSKRKEEAMAKLYNPGQVERRWQEFWQSPNVYAAAYRFDKADVDRPVYAIDTPPPFTSGELHIGHAYWNIINDTVARYKRMRGYNVLLPQGWDCQGLPTELKVQRIWKVPKEDRTLFRAKCVEWTGQMISSMKRTMTRLGYRPDWEQFEYRTMDPSYWKSVQSSLLKFHEKGLIYRKEFPVHWCPNCETALAQAELGYLEEMGSLYYLKFPREGGHIEVATTRPELLSACQALAVHPEDRRYSSLVGGWAEVPLFSRKVFILADPDVDPKFGTGVVMICTFGDEQDIRWQQKYSLTISRVIDEGGRLVNSGNYDSFTVPEARKRVVSDLKSSGILIKEERVVHRVLSHTERADCLAPVEFLIKKQWFIKVNPFNGAVTNAGKSMRWTPDYMLQRLFDWVNSIEWDWLISRQRLFGTPIPFWYCADCDEVIPSREDQLPIDPTKGRPPVDRCPKCGSERIEPSSDVCDCWVDSSITPLIISGYFDHQPHFERSYPTSMREQGHDIIRTWLYYTTLRCLILTGKPPFHDVLVNGHILGPDGYRMSKSRGNVISPEERLEEYGADSLRQALLSLTIGSDFPFRWEIVRYGKGFLQKYWSATRFAHSFLSDYTPSEGDTTHLTLIDRWVLAKLAETVRRVTQALDDYQFHIAVDAIQNFFWHEVCDQYIEAVKHRLYMGRSREDYEAAEYTLYTVLRDTTLMLAPLCPHITEEVYQRLFKGEGLLTVHADRWPEAEKLPVDKEVEAQGNLIIETISRLRAEKSEANIPLSAVVERVTIRASERQIASLREAEETVKEVLHVKEVRYEVGETLEVALG